MDTDTLQRTLESACEQFQAGVNRAEAEAAIMHFRTLPAPYDFCRHVLERSSNDYALFQAASIWKESVLREFSMLSEEQRTAMRTYALRYVSERAMDLKQYIRNALLLLFAMLVKRGFSEMSDAVRASILADLTSMIRSSDHRLRFVGCHAIAQLMNEFSNSKSSSMGVTFEFHETARAAFQRHFLLPIFQLQITLLTELMSSPISISASPASPSPLATAAQQKQSILEVNLNILLQCVTFDFIPLSVLKSRSAASASSALRPSRSSSLSTIPARFDPGAEWRTTLFTNLNTASSLPNMMFHLYSIVRGHEELSHKVRQVLIQYCSLTGPVFPDTTTSKTAWISDLLPAMTHLVAASVQETVSSLANPSGFTSARPDLPRAHDPMSEFGDFCECIQRLVLHFPLRLWVAALQTPDNFAQTLQRIAETTAHASRLAATHCLEERLTEAHDMLLQAWTLLIACGHSTEATATIWPAIQFFSSAIFKEYLSNRLKFRPVSSTVLPLPPVGGSSEDDDDDFGTDDSLDTHLSSLASLARADVNQSIGLLSGLLGERIAAIQALAASGGGASTAASTDVVNLFDDLEMLCSLTAFSLADSPDGENPLIPYEIIVYCNTMASETNPAVAIISSLLSLCEMFITRISASRSDPFCSTLVASRLLQFFSQWTASYLFPEEREYSTFSVLLSHAFNHTSANAQRIAELLLRFVATLSVHWSVEASVMADAMKLLTSLCENPRVRAYLASTETFMHLLTLDSNPASPLSHAPLDVRRLLTCNLCKIASSSSSSSPSSASGAGAASSSPLLSQIFSALQTQLSSILSRPDFGAISQQPDVLYAVSTMIERLRGIALASNALNSPIIATFFSPLLMGALVPLLDLYHNRGEIVMLLLHLFLEYADRQIAYLNPTQTSEVMNACLEVLKCYSKHNIGRRHVTKSKSIASEQEEEQSSDLFTLLRMLTALTSKDFVDLSGESEAAAAAAGGRSVFVHGGGSVGQGINVPDVVLYGLSVILPLLTPDIMQFPKLCLEFFTLLSFLLEVYPERVATLPMDLFKQLWTCTEFGIKHIDSEVGRRSLKALSALTGYYISAAGSSTGFNEKLTADPELFGRTTQFIMQQLLFEEPDLDLLDTFSEALLALIICDHARYQAVVHSIIAAQANAAIQARMNECFTQVMNGVSPVFDKKNKQLFSRNLEGFVTGIRAFMRMK